MEDKRFQTRIRSLESFYPHEPLVSIYHDQCRGLLVSFTKQGISKLKHRDCTKTSKTSKVANGIITCVPLAECIVSRGWHHYWYQSVKAENATCKPLCLILFLFHISVPLHISSFRSRFLDFDYHINNCKLHWHNTKRVLLYSMVLKFTYWIIHEIF